MNVDTFSSAWKGTVSCADCSVRLNVFRKKKLCIFCKNFFCTPCIVRREDKKFCCRKCQILTARPLDRSKLLNLKSRDLVNYLSSRHIPTNGCVEKEDLVNVLMRAVNNSCFHPSSSHLGSSSSNNSYPTTPRNYSTSEPDTKRFLSYSVQNLYDEDGIRIMGHSLADNELHSSSPEESSNSLNVQAISENNEETETKDSASATDYSKEKISIAKPLMLCDIKNKTDLEALTVKQLKELLMRNRTDFKGCIEREELIEKARRLWNDYILSRKDLENLTTDELCKICMDAPIECVLLECGHMATCTTCGKQLCECPICRQFVVRCVRTFKA